MSNKESIMPHRQLFCVLIAAASILGLASAGQAEEWIITKNPYADVDWEAFGEHKANLHTHTTESDGRHTPAEVIDDYYEAGYEILAITDHNHVTWSWPDYGRDPEELLMVAVVGNELSRHHHANTLFTKYPEPIRRRSTGDLATSLRENEELGALMFLCHPGRYWRPQDGQVPAHVRDEYAELFAEYPKLLGFEIHNQNDRYPQDRLLWDALLVESMPRRSVLAFANDDTHSSGHVGLNANVFVVRELSLEHVRLALKRGQFYATTITTHPRDERDMTLAPRIAGIDYDREAGTLTIDARAGDEPLEDEAYTWISAGGEQVHTGPTLDLNAVEGLDAYVRAEIRSPGGTTYTQAFGIRQRQ